MNRFLLLLCLPLFASGAPTLTLDAPEAIDGALQTLTLSLEKSTKADVYLMLTGTKGELFALKADGTFAAAGRIVPFLVDTGFTGRRELHTWRVTGLDLGTWTWSVVLTKPGAGLKPAGRLGIGKAIFTVKKSDAPLFAELAEGAGKGGVRDKLMRRKAGRADFDADGLKDLSEEIEEFSAELAETPSLSPPPTSPETTPRPPVVDEALSKARAKPVDPAKPGARPRGAVAEEEPRILGEAGAVDALGAGIAPLPAAEGKKASKEIQAAKSLSAGATDDNQAFGDFLEFLTKRNNAAVMCQDVAQRRFITVLDAKGRHVSNADVSIHHKGQLLFAGRTTANGQTLFCPAALPDLKAGKQTLNIEVAKGLLKQAWTAEIEVKRDENLNSQFDPKALPEQPMAIDLMPLPRCGVGARAKAGAPGAKAIAVEDVAAARRALAAKPVEVVAADIDWLDAGFKVDLGAVALAPPVREKAVPKGDWVLRLPGVLDTEAPRIDLVFQIDTTGSMRDEIRAVQATLQSTAKRIDQMDPKPLVRWGLVLYGDRGDKYVVRRYAFTPDVNELHKWVLNMEMTGGGDTPESALEALHASVNEMAWDTGDAIRLIFLVADAPPHLDYKRPYTYVDKMREATAKGIKIFPTAASGLDKTGEFIFRQWAQATMGKFLYITYGAGGAGGPAGETPHEVAQPKKQNNLDDLIVKTVADELANWRSPTLYESGEPGVEEPKLQK